MWKKVALSSVNSDDQFQCYQYAIETLQNPSHNWIKIELYLELAQLLHFHDKPIDQVLLHVQVAIDMVMRTANIKPTVANLRGSQGNSQQFLKFF